MLLRLGAIIAAAAAAVLLTVPAVRAEEPEEAGEQSIEEMIREQTVVQQFLVVGAAKTYAAARSQLERFAKRSGIPIDLRDLKPHEGSLTFPDGSCESGYPCYFPRGRFDGGAYFSIELSGSYKSMRKGYFVIMAASGDPTEVSRTKRQLARKGIPSTIYAEPVYMGCMH